MNSLQLTCAVVIFLVIVIIVYVVYNNRGEKTEALTSASEQVVAELPNIKKFQQMIEELISQDLQNRTSRHIGLHKMCSYALAGGKKIRSVIALSIAHHITAMRTPRWTAASEAAVAVEYLHAASLVLDDIADKDDYRRGRKSLHTVFGVGKAQMCALYLIGQAGALLQSAAVLAASTKDHDGDKFIVFIYDNLFDNLRGLIEGQYMDITGTDASDEEVMHKKTGTMFEIPFVLSWAIANAKVPSDQEMDLLKQSSHAFGQVFQVADDFEDLEDDKANSAKFNYVLNHGVADSITHVQDCVNKFDMISGKLGILTPELSEAATHLIQKVSMYQ